MSRGYVQCDKEAADYTYSLPFTTKDKGKGIQVLYSDIFALTLLRVTRLHHRLSV